MTEPMLIGVLVVYLAFREYAQSVERASWTRERQALLERAAPGVRLTERAPSEPRAWGTDAYEYEVEQERLGNCGVRIGECGLEAGDGGGRVEGVGGPGD